MLLFIAFKGFRKQNGTYLAPYFLFIFIFNNLDDSTAGSTPVSRSFSFLASQKLAFLFLISVLSPSFLIETLPHLCR